MRSVFILLGSHYRMCWQKLLLNVYSIVTSQLKQLEYDHDEYNILILSWRELFCKQRGMLVGVDLKLNLL